MSLRLPLLAAGLLLTVVPASPAGAAPGSGLRVTALSAGTGTVNAGERLTLVGTVVNRSARARTARVTLSLQGAGGTRGVATLRLSRVKPGAKVRFAKTAIVPATLPAGAFSLRACVRGGLGGAASCRAAAHKLAVTAAAVPAGPSQPAAPPAAPPTPDPTRPLGDNVPPVTPPATVTPAPDPDPAPPTTGATGATGSTGATGPTGPPRIDVEDGVTQPVFGFDDAIRQRVWVPIPYDTDGDGTYDRVAVDIKRPRATADGLKVPIIMDASPYYSTVGRGNEAQLKHVDPATGLVDQWPLFLDNYFVPRGYAVALVDTVGTDASTGCPIVGGDADIQGIKRVIDWMNGRAKAYDSVSGGNEVPADWTTGHVGMIGKSYDATHANGVAATGVDGLKTIVPVAGISSWYLYYDINGLRFSTGSGAAGLSNTVTNPERRTACAAARQSITTRSGAGTTVSPNDAGNLNEYWDERDYVKDADKVKASVFLVHGVNDDNVKPNNYGDWWNALAANDVPRKIWLSQLGHVDPFDYDRDEWVDTLHRWFDHWLQDVPNGIMDEPMAHIEQQTTATTTAGAAATDPVYKTFSSWPDPGAQPTPLYLGATGPSGASGAAGAAPLVADRSGATGTSGSQLTSAFQDSTFLDANNRTQGLTEAQAIANPDAPLAGRLAYTSPVLTKDVRISGQSSLQVLATVDQTDTALSALLVDYAPTPFVKVNAASGDGVANDNPPVKDCVGQSDATDSACYLRVHRVYTTTTGELVAHGSIDGRNRDSLRFKSDIGVNSPTWFTVPIWADDYTFRAGHRIGVVLEGSDRSYAVAKTNRATITVRIGDSRLTLPVVGGKAALGF